MKKTKKVSIALSSIMLASICSFDIVSAATNAGALKKVSYSKIPGGGNCKVDLKDGNKKVTEGKTASFKMDSGNLLAINTRLIFDNQNLASDIAYNTGDKNKIETAAERSGVKKGGTYYNKTCSHTFEGSNSSSPDIWFSADNLK